MRSASKSDFSPGLLPARVLAVVLACAQLLAGTGALLLPAPAHAAKAAAKPQPANVTLNFVNAEIDGVARAMAAVLDKQIVVDPRVKGTITLYSDQPLTAREAYLNFLAALRGQGFTVVEVSGLLKVVPEAEAKLQTGVVSAGPSGRAGDQVITQIFKLQNENPNNLVAILRPLISPNNTINSNVSNNTLVITDYADNLNRLAKIIAAMDTAASSDLEIIPLKHAIASDVAAVVQKFADAPSAPGATTSQSTTVLADPRSNSLLVRAVSPARLAAIRSVVAKLDKPSEVGIGGSGIHVVYLKNADAVKLAQVLRASFAGDARGGGSAAGGASASGLGSASTGAPSTPGAGMGGTSSSGGASPQATAPVQGSAAPSTGGFIQADPATNSLIITAGDALYRQLRAVIDQLDSRRAQVYVETMIVEMAADKAAQFGVQWQGLIGKDGDKNGLALGTNFSNAGNNIVDLTKASVLGSSGDLSLAQGMNLGLVHNFSGTYALGALAQFLQSNTDSNILSTPNVIALDNEEAKITIGKNVPFVTGQYTSNNSSSGSVNPFQTIERKDVGLTLRIKPQIGENGTVRMTVFQENSSIASESTSGPTTNKNSIETTIVVDDGQVMVLGGQMQDSYSAGRQQVPGLGSIPVLGNLFRSQTRNATKTILMVFLRPVVMRDQAASNALTVDRYETIRALQKDMTPAYNAALPIQEVPVLPPMPAPAAPAPAPASTSAPAPAPAASGATKAP